MLKIIFLIHRMMNFRPIQEKTLPFEHNYVFWSAYKTISDKIVFRQTHILLRKPYT